MYSKLREDLPSAPNRRYSREDIKLFDKHREKYKEGVSYSKKMHSSVASIVDTDSEEYEKCVETVEKFVEENKEQINENFDKYGNINNLTIFEKERYSQILQKYTPKKVRRWRYLRS